MSIIRYNANDFVPTSFSNLVDQFFNDSLTRAGGSSVVADDTVPLDLALSEVSDTNGDGYANFVLAGGSKTVYVGGKLQVSATDQDGVYTGTFQINADYQ